MAFFVFSSPPSLLLQRRREREHLVGDPIRCGFETLDVARLHHPPSFFFSILFFLSLLLSSSANPN
jgi:hypothetical protein